MASLATETKKYSKKKSAPIACGICWNDCNKSNRKPVECPYCDLKACRECVKYYITSKTDLAHCMGCNKPWDRKFLQNALTKSYFGGTWKNHRKSMLFETEKARFPDTMPKVEKTIKIRKNEEILKQQLILEEEAYRKYIEAKNKCYRTRSKIQSIKNDNGESKTEKRQFIKKCPQNDCTGFLSTGWKCAVCDARVCSKCHEFMGYEADSKNSHECNPDTVAAIELIKQETKPCPQCSAPIYKISGCDQMWCTSCNIAFSWRTGLKVNGVIHNPHYYEFMRQNGGNAVQNPGAVNCGGLPYHNQIRDITRNLDYYYSRVIKNKLPVNTANQLPRSCKKYTMVLGHFHRCASHFQHVILDPIRRAIQQNRDNEDLRIKFIMKEITEESFKTTLIKRDNVFEKKQAMLHIYELMGNVYTETVISIYNLMIEHLNNNIKDLCLKAGNHIAKKKDIDIFLNKTNAFQNKFDEINLNIHKVRLYCNKELLKISLIYNQVVDIIDVHGNTSSLKKIQCKKMLDNESYSFEPIEVDGRIKYIGKTYRSRRPAYIGLDEV